MKGRSAPRVRAVVLNHNGAADTLACVDTLLRQRHWPLDVVVVDNGSSPSDLADLRSGLPDSALLVRSERNLGFAGGMNIGARSSEAPRPDYVLFLNNDLLLTDPGTVSALITAVNGDTRRVAASPLVAVAGAECPVESQIQVRRIPGFWTILVAGSWWLRRLPGLRRLADWFVYADQRPYRRGAVYECESINGSCFLARTSFLDEVGFLDEGTFLYKEELVLGWQILARDRIAALTTAVQVIHSVGRATGHGGDRIRLAMLKVMVSSELYYCEKYLQSGFAKVWLLLLVRTLDIATRIAAQPLARALRAIGWGDRGRRQ